MAGTRRNERDMPDGQRSDCDGRGASRTRYENRKANKRVANVEEIQVNNPRVTHPSVVNAVSKV